MRDWGILVLVILVLYVTGLHTTVAAFAQRMLLETHLLTPKTELLEEDKKVELDYSFSLQTLDGQPVNATVFKNKVLFVNIWATWCAPCIAEMPGIADLYSELKQDQSIAFVMLATDRDQSKPGKFIERKGYDLPVYIPNGFLPEVFRVPSIPTTFVFDKNGKLISKKIGMAKYNTNSFKKFLRKHAEKSD